MAASRAPVSARRREAVKRKAQVLPLLACFLFVLTAPAAVQVTTAAPRERIAPPSPAASAVELEQKGDELRTAKNYLDALDYYQAALKKQRSPALFNKIGIIQLQMNRYPEAKKTFESAIKAGRKVPEGYNNLGAAFYAMKKYGRAVKNYKKALALREETASFHSNLGTAYFAQKEMEKAAAEYRRALELDPDIFERQSQAGIAAHMVSVEDRAKYSFVLAKMFAQNGNFDRALQYLRKAMEDGYKGIDEVYKDSEFAGLRKDKRFEELMASRPQAIPQ
jgi:tetratricopeptide (TPR) repeat protein